MSGRAGSGGSIALIAEWLELAAAWRGAMVHLHVAGSSRHLLCHVLPGLWFAQVPGNRLLCPEDVLDGPGVDAMVWRGWLAPCPDTLHWRRTWSRRVPAIVVARELAAVTDEVLRASPDRLAASVVPCGSAACGAHGALGDCGVDLGWPRSPVTAGRPGPPPHPPR